jgi:excinuclease ABC subunit C
MRLSSFLREKISQLPTGPGVYLFKDRLGSILYVGKAKNLKSRVRSYFFKGAASVDNRPKILGMMAFIQDLETIELKSETEALLLEGKLIKEFKPKYNTDFLDDKRFPWIRADVQNLFPKFTLVRDPLPDKSRYFGPFLQDRAVFNTLKGLRTRFGVLLSDTQVTKIGDNQYALYSDARSEIYGFPSDVTPEEYRTRVEQACAFLEGETQDWISDCRTQMEKAALTQQYEKAAELRDLLSALEHTVPEFSTGRKFRGPNLPRAPMGRESLKALAEVLEMSDMPKIIECFDISHISGTFTVASMVRFTNGIPDKRHYRRFKIQTFEGNDDYRAMNEVVNRRYARLLEQQQPLPDLIIIDGGLGQVRAALIGFDGLSVKPPMLIGLAKREESIVFPDNRPMLQLPLHHPGLQLIQRLRDEAHRFANTFSAQLRRNKIRESLLDEVPGLGEKRKSSLLKHFGSIKRLQNATVEEICLVPYINKQIAELILQTLASKS